MAIQGVHKLIAIACEEEENSLCQLFVEKDSSSIYNTALNAQRVIYSRTRLYGSWETTSVVAASETRNMDGT